MELTKLLQIRNVLLAHINDKVSASLAYRIMKYLKSTDQEEDFYLKRTQELADEFGEKDADGKPVRNTDGGINIQHDKIEECKNLISELNKTNVDVPATKFALAELSELKLSVKEMYILDDLITP